MGFWTKISISWGMSLALFGLAVPCSGQDGSVPWLLQPLEGTSKLALTQVDIAIDFAGSQKSGWVDLDFRSKLTAPDYETVRESLFVVNADPDSRVTWNDRDVAQERLVMPVPTLDGKTQAKGMARVSVFQLSMLRGESGSLRFQGRQPLDFETEHRSALRVLLPMRKSWRNVSESELSLSLAPELRLLSPGFSPTSGLQRRRIVNSYQPRLQSVRIEAPLMPVSWGGPVLSIPALQRTWGWGAAALLLALTVGGASRKGWRWVVPLTLVLAWLAWTGDARANQIRFYQHAKAYEDAVRLFRLYVVPGLAILGALTLWGVGSRFNREEEL